MPGWPTSTWAFGCVVFELLTGRPLFAGDTVSDTLAAVLRAEPDWSSLPKGTPAAVVALLRRCLTRDPRQRLRDIGDARLELSSLADPTRQAPRGPTSRLRTRLGLAAAALAIAGAGAAAAGPSPPATAGQSGTIRIPSARAVAASRSS